VSRIPDLLAQVQDPEAVAARRREAARELLGDASLSGADLIALLRAPDPGAWLTGEILDLLFDHPAAGPDLLWEAAGHLGDAAMDALARRPQALANQALRLMMLRSGNREALLALLVDATDDEIPALARALCRTDGRSVIRWIETHPDRARRLLRPLDLRGAFLSADLPLHAEAMGALHHLLGSSEGS
jgi:hypothetical protein